MVLGIAWLVVGLSLGALTLFWILVRKGAAAKVASLFYLVPPITAAMGWLVFGERLGVMALVGMAVVAFGVLLAARPGPQPGA
jgi:drug/metabolite transporter (DMT)-like permease